MLKKKLGMETLLQWKNNKRVKFEKKITDFYLVDKIDEL